MTQELSRAEIERRLLELERSPQPEASGPQFTCYLTSPPPDHWIYVCPACGKHTAYMGGPTPDRRQAPAPLDGPTDGERRVSSRSLESLVELEGALSVARELPKGSGISLDESALCAFCRPDARKYDPVLEVRLPGQRRRRLAFKLDDVIVLRAFLNGSDRYEGPSGSVCPLGGELRRLRRLLLGRRSGSGHAEG